MELTNWRTIPPAPYSLWSAVISRAGGPDELASRAAWEAAGSLSGLCLAMLAVESRYGTAFNLNTPERKNYLNLRPPTGDGYLLFPTVADGIRTWRERITSPTYKNAIYATTATLADLIHVYAPSSDGNNEREYVRTIERLIDEWGLVTEEKPQMAELRVILNPGHRNATGGNPQEAAFTDDLERAYFNAFSAAGYETVALGDTQGGLDAACRRMAAQIASAPGPCVLLDLHLEGSPAPGVFCIVPDVTGLRTNAPVEQDPADTWTNNSKDRELAKQISSRISAATGLTLRRGIREPGIMDESETGVGAQGFRLATFAYTSPHRVKATRLVVEHGNHTVQPDKSIIFAPGFADKCAKSALAAVKAVYGNPGTIPTPTYADPAPITWEEGDVGDQDLNGTPALAFLLEVEVIRKSVQPQVSDTDSRPTGIPRKKTTKLRAIGSYRGADRNAYVVLRDGSRIKRSDVRPLVPLPKAA